MCLPGNQLGNQHRKPRSTTCSLCMDDLCGFSTRQQQHRTRIHSLITVYVRTKTTTKKALLLNRLVTKCFIENRGQKYWTQQNKWERTKIIWLFLSYFWTESFLFFFCSGLDWILLKRSDAFSVPWRRSLGWKRKTLSIFIFHITSSTRILKWL